jgi:hypothetical protein
MLIIVWFVIAVCLLLYGYGMVPWAKPFIPTSTTAVICLALSLVFAYIVLHINNQKKRDKYGFYSIGGARGSW